MLETIRQYAEEQLAATGSIDVVRDRHARYYAEQATAHFAIWDSPDQRNALDWVDSNFANLRAGFRWAVDQLDFPAAAAIAAHATMLGWMLQRYEPVGWAEEILRPAEAADLALLPRLLTAASVCLWSGRAEVAVGYAHRAVELEKDPRYDPFETGWSAWFEAAGNVFAGHTDRSVEIYADLARRQGVARVLGLGGMLYLLPTVGRAEEAIAIAEEALSVARSHANPSLIAYVLAGQGRALAGTDPERALSVLHEGLRYATEHRLSSLVVRVERECALLDAVHGDPVQALTSIEAAIESLHRAGDHDTTAMTLAYLTVLFDRAEQPDAAATVHGATVGHASTSLVPNLAVTVQHLRDLLGGTAFERCVAIGAAMDLPEAVQYARQHIALTRAELRSRPQPTPA